jgi:hypothetical protein
MKMGFSPCVIQLARRRFRAEIPHRACPETALALWTRPIKIGAVK